MAAMAWLLDCHDSPQPMRFAKSKRRCMMTFTRGWRMSCNMQSQQHVSCCGFLSRRVLKLVGQHCWYKGCRSAESNSCTLVVKRLASHFSS